MIPNEKTYCELDPHVVDKWGVPVLRFHWEWGENERKMARDMQEVFTSIIETAGGTVRGTASRSRPAAAPGAAPEVESGPISTGGEIIHEAGTIRMGSDPKRSVLNKHSQAHDVKNLFVADAAPFVTNPDKNPTLTIMALSWRASDYLIELGKRGEI
jgi:choline dehydrogenase-like flavoprotein